jgi:CRP-like cAMP-binding protein
MAGVGYERTLMLEFLHELDTFKGCDERALELVADAFSGRHILAPGEVLCTEGGSATSWWVVLEGSADVTVGGTHVGSVARRDTVGELALFDDLSTHSASVVADERLDVLEFDKAPFIDTVRTSPDLALSLLREAARRLRAANALLCATTAG